MNRTWTQCVVSLLTVVAFGAARASAADHPPVAGTLTLTDKELKLQDVVAWTTTLNDEPVVVVLASSRPIDRPTVAAALRGKKEQPEGVLRQPLVRITFDRKGAPRSFYATGNGFTTNGSGGKIQGEGKLADERLVGQVKLPVEGREGLERGFEFRFDVPLIGSSTDAPVKVAAAKLGVTGTYKGAGKAAKIAYVSVKRGEPFSDKPTLELLFTEKDHSKDKRAASRVFFGDHGSWLKIVCHENGDMVSCQVGHQALKRAGFSSSGELSFEAFHLVDRQAQGTLTTSGEKDAFGESWEVDLQFAVALPADVKIGSEAPAKDDEPSESAPRKPTKTVGAPKPAKPEKPMPAGASPKARELPFLTGVEGVQYKQLVEQIGYRSDSAPKALAGEIVKKLDAAGWQKDGADLIGANAILNRKKGSASLTIFVKPDGDGSQVTVITKGLDWAE